MPYIDPEDLHTIIVGTVDGFRRQREVTNQLGEGRRGAPNVPTEFVAFPTRRLVVNMRDIVTSKSARP